MVKQAAACHREALAGGGVGAGTGSALFREPPPAGAPPFADWWQSETDIFALKVRWRFLACVDSAPLKQEAEGHAVSFIPRRDVCKTRRSYCAVSCNVVS